MTKIKNSPIMKILAAAAVLMMIIGASAGVMAQVRNSTDSVIFIDVNPSIELKVNADEKIVSAKALNDDAKIVLNAMNLKGTDVNIAVNAIIGSMLINGYLSDINNSILVSVENADTAKGAELQKKLMAEVNDLLNVSSIQGAVLSQTVTADDYIEKISNDYGISIGKATLLAQIIDAEKDKRELDPAMLATLSINELNLIFSSLSADVSGLSSVGTPSDKAYIGEDAAKILAYEHAKVNETEVTYYKVKLDTEDGIIVYDVDFNTSKVEYEYEINAQSGEIISFDVDMEHRITSSDKTTTDAADYIGLDAAKNIAFKHAGCNEADVTMKKAKLDIDDGKAEYDIEFCVGGTEYEYEIDAVTGDVISVDTEAANKNSVSTNNNGGANGNAHDNTNGNAHDNSHGNTNNNTSGNTNNNNGTASFITGDEAKAAAFAHANVSENDVILEKVKFDIDDGVAEYEIEFRIGNVEYEYDIDAYTGEVLNCEKETDD